MPGLIDKNYFDALRIYVGLRMIFLLNLFFTVNGGYASWSSWTACSRTCGDGERVRQRSCQNPPPSNGGATCDKLGPSVEKQKCNLASCPGRSIDFEYLYDFGNVEFLLYKFMGDLFLRTF